MIELQLCGSIDKCILLNHSVMCLALFDLSDQQLGLHAMIGKQLRACAAKLVPAMRLPAIQ